MTPKRYSVEGNSFWPVESSMLEVTGTIIGKSAPSVLRRKNNRVPECGPPKVCLARESRRAEKYVTAERGEPEFRDGEEFRPTEVRDIFKRR